MTNASPTPMHTRKPGHATGEGGEKPWMVSLPDRAPSRFFAPSKLGFEIWKGERGFRPGLHMLPHLGPNTRKSGYSKPHQRQHLPFQTAAAQAAQSAGTLRLALPDSSLPPFETEAVQSDPGSLLEGASPLNSPNWGYLGSLRRPGGTFQAPPFHASNATRPNRGTGRGTPQPTIKNINQYQLDRPIFDSASGTILIQYMKASRKRGFFVQA